MCTEGLATMSISCNCYIDAAPIVQDFIYQLSQTHPVLEYHNMGTVIMRGAVQQQRYHQKKKKVSEG